MYIHTSSMKYDIIKISYRLKNKKPLRKNSKKYPIPLNFYFFGRATLSHNDKKL